MSKTIASIRHSLLGTRAALGATIQILEREGISPEALRYLESIHESMGRDLADLKEHQG